MINFKNFNAITFDCYGTLIDWETGILEAIHPVLHAHNIHISDDNILEMYARFEAEAEKGTFAKYRTILNRVMAGILSEHGINFTDVTKDCLPESIQNWQPFPDTHDALEALGKKYKLGIISNIDNDLIRHSTTNIGIDFDWIITAEEARSYKPSLNNFRAAIDRIGFSKDKILHVAQSLYHDIAPANEFGLTTVWVNRRADKPGSGATPEAKGKPDIEVKNLASLISLINKGT